MGMISVHVEHNIIVTEGWVNRGPDYPPECYP